MGGRALWRLHLCLFVCVSASISLELALFFTRRMPYLPPNQQRQSTEGNFANRKCYNLIFSPCGGNYASYLFYWTVLDTGLLSQIMWYKFSPTSHLLYGRAFQFGQKSFHSILFDSCYRIDFFDSNRFGNLINLPLVHWYSNSKLGVIFIVCIA